MSNLGFQTIYGVLNRRSDIVCERAFLPDPDDLAIHERSGAPVLSLETQRSLREFDCVAFSTTYENDYPHLLRLLELSGIPVNAQDRGAGDPLVSMGGVCAWANPDRWGRMNWFFWEVGPRRLRSGGGCGRRSAIGGGPEDLSVALLGVEGV
jgi:hypothetical protein